MSWLRKRKVAPLPVPATPQMIAATLLDKVQQGEIDHVVVLFKRKNGNYGCDYSSLSTTDILMHEKAMQVLALDHYRNSDA